MHGGICEVLLCDTDANMDQSKQQTLHTYKHTLHALNQQQQQQLREQQFMQQLSD